MKDLQISTTKKKKHKHKRFVNFKVKHPVYNVTVQMAIPVIVYILITNMWFTMPPIKCIKGKETMSEWTTQ